MSTNFETRGKKISLKLFFAAACTAGMVSVSALAEAPMHGDGQRVSAAQDLGKVAQDVLGGLNIARSDLHNLDLRGTNIAVLPEGLSIGGDLYLDSTKINALPEGLSVGGGLYLRGTKITAPPEGLSVGGELYLDGTDITELPKGLRVGGNLDLSGTKITELPRVPAFAPIFGIVSGASTGGTADTVDLEKPSKLVARSTIGMELPSGD